MSKTIKHNYKMDPVVARLHRVKGQLDGIEKMYTDETCDCTKLVVQIQAARAALGKVAGMILTDEASRCVEKGELKKLEKIVKVSFNSL
ncbi:metal-sensitive transcriptional regulator [Patescibacteria group bacterium]